MNLQSNFNKILGITGAIKLASDKKQSDIEKASDKKQSDIEKASDKKQSDIEKARNSLYTANEKVNVNKTKIEKESQYESFTNKRGRQQFRDKTTGQLIKRFDYEQHQKALAAAQEQLELASTIQQSFKKKLAMLTGGK